MNPDGPHLPESGELSSAVREDLRDLTQELLDGPRFTVGLPRLRGATVTRARSLEPFSPTKVVRAWELRTGDGQTLYVTKLRRKPKSRLPEPER